MTAYRRSGNTVKIFGFSELKEGQAYIVNSLDPLILEEIFPKEIFIPLTTCKIGDIEINFAAREVSLKGEHIVLSKTEWKILSILYERKGSMVSHSTILREAWGPEYKYDYPLLRTWMSRLRTKIPDCPIHTIIGQGYRLDA